MKSARVTHAQRVLVALIMFEKAAFAKPEVWT
jgi:hypothetical protein